jgi:hypothetical protein
MSHNTKPCPTASADAMSRKSVVAHAGAKSVHTHMKRGRRGASHPIDVKQPNGGPLPGSPGSGAAPGANGPPTTGGDMFAGGPLGST